MAHNDGQKRQFRVPYRPPNAKFGLRATRRPPLDKCLGLPCVPRTGPDKPDTRPDCAGEGGVRGLQVAGFRLRVVGGFRFPVHGNGRPRFQVAGPSSRPRPIGSG